MRSTRRGKIVRIESWLRLVVVVGRWCSSCKGDLSSVCRCRRGCSEVLGCGRYVLVVMRVRALRVWHLRIEGGHTLSLSTRCRYYRPVPGTLQHTQSNIFIDGSYWQCIFSLLFFIICQKRFCNGQWFTRNLNSEHPPVKLINRSNIRTRWLDSKSNFFFKYRNI